ncbi:MAG: nicotinate-nucleotide--dimethylbenzimidazole phosphoribosyltransferase [Lachnospiraceae bacterium]|nr:nicotinate-nucleotide--dimethylbenzimidazole phosphoribosyltransferase [Lachnospiraceae bacterium]
MTLEELFGFQVKQINQALYEEALHHWDSISKPLDGLGDFEKITAQILAINDNKKLEKLRKVLVVMCADHGVVEEGVSQCGQEVTASVAKLLGEGRSTASTMAAFAGADCITVDVGIHSEEIFPGVRNHKIMPGTNNLMEKPAMGMQEVLSAIEIGISIARECKEKGYHLLAAGEMGIGNTTAGTLVLCGLTGVAVDAVLGRGAGLSDEGLGRKRHVVASALDKYDLHHPEESREYALKVMQKVGGLELAAMTGLYIGGAVYGIPVMIDGVLSAVSALLAQRIMPGCKAYMIPSHAGREKGTGYVLGLLGLKPLLNGDMALGEGTGALMAMPLLDMTLDFFRKATTFAAGKIEQYKRLDTE